MLMNLKQAVDIAYPTRHYSTQQGIDEMEERMAQHVDDYEVRAVEVMLSVTSTLQKLYHELPSWVIHANEHLAYTVRTLAPLQTVSSLVVERMNHEMKDFFMSNYRVEYQVRLSFS